MTRINTISPKLNSSRRAFTLIELLVVISVIAVLTGMVLAVSGIGAAKMRRSRVEAERAVLVMAIEEYKKDKGVYPPDNTNNPALSPLYYELSGTISAISNNSVSYTLPATGDVLTSANVSTLFGGRAGFINTAPTQGELQDFTRSLGKGGHIATFTTNGLNYILFGLPVPGPGERSANDGSKVSVWNYVSTNPTNNGDGGYDLWLDVSYSGRVNRFSNWSKDPQAQ